MKTLVGDGRIDPALLGDDASSSGLPRSLAARIYLDAGLLEGALPSQQTYRDELFEFKGGATEGRVRQAVTDTVEWKLQTDTAAAVVIDLIPAAGGETKRLLLAPSAFPHQLFVSNLPAENSPDSDSHAAHSEDMSGLHFGAYYALLMDSPKEMPLPTLASAAEPRKGASGARPAFCHLAMFSRP
jgi:hypothetical protein